MSIQMDDSSNKLGYKSVVLAGLLPVHSINPTWDIVCIFNMEASFDIGNLAIQGAIYLFVALFIGLSQVEERVCRQQASEGDLS